jgi:pimeloyl-ACP methyl ester carboxylesterase
VLRFNFRGVGKSEGVHDGKGGEEEDLKAALDHLAKELPGTELWTGGFSFGARTAASYARRDSRIVRLVLVAIPVGAFDVSFLREVKLPGFVLMAENDQYGTLETSGCASRICTLAWRPTRSRAWTTSSREDDRGAGARAPLRGARARKGSMNDLVYPADKVPSIRQVMMPRDTNAVGTIFGGVIPLAGRPRGRDRGAQVAPGTDRHRVDGQGRVQAAGVRRRPRVVLHEHDADREDFDHGARVRVGAAPFRRRRVRARHRSGRDDGRAIGKDSKPTPIARKP